MFKILSGKFNQHEVKDTWGKHPGSKEERQPLTIEYLMAWYTEEKLAQIAIAEERKKRVHRGQKANGECEGCLGHRRNDAERRGYENVLPNTAPWYGYRNPDVAVKPQTGSGFEVD